MQKKTKRQITIRYFNAEQPPYATVCFLDPDLASGWSCDETTLAVNVEGGVTHYFPLINLERWFVETVEV